MSELVPVIDLNAPDAISQIDQACRSVGFLSIIGHGVPQHVIERMLAATAEFFALPLDEKLGLRSPGPEVNRGYTAKGSEGLIYSLGVEGTPPDLFEAFNIGPDGWPADDPIRQLHGFAATYLDFATEHANLLRSLFEHRMEQDRPFPEDILIMVMQAFALMHEPLVRLLPNKDSTEVALLARMMFSAVHGIISLGLEERMVAVPPEKLRQQVAQFVDTHLAGLGIIAVRKA